MSEESPTSETAANTPRKKTATKKTSTKSTTAKKPVAGKSTARKAPAKKTAAQKAPATTKAEKTTTASASVDASSEKVESGTREQAETAPEQENRQAKHEDDYNASKMVENLKGRDWPKIIQRALLMFFFGVLGWITLSLAFFLAATQVVFTIFVGEANPALTRLIKQGGNYIRDVLDYLSFGSDECPFPFGRGLPDAD